MKYTVLPFALMISMVSAAEDGWVAVGQAPTAKPAVSSAPTTSTSFPVTSPAPVATANTSLQVELLTMVEAMQQEIAELRGTVEEQEHTIEMMKRQQQQRYLDLDKRMAELMQTSTPRVAASAVSNGEPVLSADELYASAMTLIKKKDFAKALIKLDEFATTYPEDGLAANAFYWSGEVQLAEGNYPLAITQFTRVIEQHGEHAKAADSHYKLAVAFDRSGDPEKAKKILGQVISQYEGKSDSVVRLAKRYLKRLTESS